MEQNQTHNPPNAYPETLQECLEQLDQLRDDVHYAVLNFADRVTFITSAAEGEGTDRSSFVALELITEITGRLKNDIQKILQKGNEHAKGGTP